MYSQSRRKRGRRQQQQLRGAGRKHCEGGAAGAPERCDQSEGPDAEMEPPSPPAYIGEKGCSIGRVVSSNGTQRIYQPVASKAVAGEPMGNLLLLLLNAAGDGGPSKAAHAA